MNLSPKTAMEEYVARIAYLQSQPIKTNNMKSYQAVEPDYAPKQTYGNQDHALKYGPAAYEGTASLPSTATKGSYSGRVGEDFGILFEELEMLSTQANILIDLIAPILVKPMDTELKTTGGGPPEPNRCDLAHKLCDVRKQVSNLKYRLEEASGRVNL